MLYCSLNLSVSLIVSLHITCLVLCWTSIVKVHCYETYDTADHMAEESSLNRLSHYSSSVQDLNTTFDINDQNNATLVDSTNTSTFGAGAGNLTTTRYNIKQISQPKTVDEDPLHAILPKIKFSCKNRNEGYYADYDFCDIFHFCKSTGYRFTFLCPNNSYYNKELMACEHNVTQLENCKSKTKSQRMVDEVVDIVSNLTNNHNLFDQLKADMADIDQSLMEDTYPILSSTTTSNAVESKHSARDREQLTDNLSVSNEAPLTELDNASNIETKYNRQLSFDDVDNQMSSTTLIPPSLFVELPNNDLKSMDILTKNDKLFAETQTRIKFGFRRPSLLTTTELPEPHPALPTPLSTTTPPTITYVTPTTTTIKPNLVVSNIQLSKQETESSFVPYIPNQYQYNRDFGKLGSTSSYNDSGNLSNLSNHYANIANQSTTNKKVHNANLERTYANQWNNINSHDFDNILKTLDMSNYDLNANYKKPYFNVHSTGNRFNVNANYATFRDKTKETFKQKSPPSENNKFLISIPKFLREGLPAQYLKNVPKLFRSLNTFKGDYETAESEVKPVIMPKKSDNGPNNFQKDDSTLNLDNMSMLSIPVLVPISLSQDDYRQRISTSVLKPIVIPLKEKGKLIPAYVLQFSGKHRGRYKRNASIGKRKLLQKLVKPNLLYNMLPSIIKNIQSKPVPTAPKPAFDLLMQSQKTIPMYSLPRPTVFPNGAASKMVNYANPYDLADYRHFITPFYFVDPQTYLQYRPSKKSPLFKRLPLRAPIPVSKLNSTASKFYPKVITPSDLMAVDSQHINQKLNMPQDYNFRQLYKNSNANANKLPANYENNRLTSPLGKAYYSPLLYFGNPVIGSDLVRFKPLIKDQNFIKKAKASKVLLNANIIKNETKQFDTQSTSNTTAPMPANIYVPDDFLDEYQVDLNSNDLHSNNDNHTSTKSDSKSSIDYAQNEFVDQPHNLQLGESSTIQVFTKFNRPSHDQLIMKPANNRINNRNNNNNNNKMSIDPSKVIFSKEITAVMRAQSDYDNDNDNKNKYRTSLLSNDRESSNKYSQVISQPIEERNSKQTDHSNLLASYLEHLKFDQTL